MEALRNALENRNYKELPTATLLKSQSLQQSVCIFVKNATDLFNHILHAFFNYTAEWVPYFHEPYINIENIKSNINFI